MTTGKVDVQAAAAALPAELAEADEPLDDGDAAEPGEDATDDSEVDEG